APPCLRRTTSSAAAAAETNSPLVSLRAAAVGCSDGFGPVCLSGSYQAQPLAERPAYQNRVGLRPPPDDGAAVHAPRAGQVSLPLTVIASPLEPGGILPISDIHT